MDYSWYIHALFDPLNSAEKPINIPLACTVVDNHIQYNIIYVTVIVQVQLLLIELAMVKEVVLLCWMMLRVSLLKID